MNALADLLLVTAPSWANVMSSDGGLLRVDVAPPRLSGAPGDRFELVIDTHMPEAVVSEVVVGARLPRTCPERHINGDGSFCLGLRRAAVTTQDQANMFWQTLRGYLLAQQFAERHGRWPAGRGLSHGFEAADCQIAAEQAASRCGLSDDYAVALDYKTGWLAETLPDLLQEDSCDHSTSSRPNENGTIVVKSGCPFCDALADLITHERARRAADATFVRIARLLRTCCRTMPGCPLRCDEELEE